MEELEIRTPKTFDFKNKKLNEISVKIAKAGENLKKNKVELSKLLATVLKEKLYEQDEFKSLEEYAEKTFNMKKGLAHQLAAVGNRYYLNGSETAKKMVEMFPHSTLAETVQLDDAKIEEALKSETLKPGMTEAQVREAVKPIKHTTPRVLKDYEIDVKVIKGNDVNTFHYDKATIEVTTTELFEKFEMERPDEKQYVREGKYEGSYHRGERIYLDRNGTIMYLKYGISATAKPEKVKSKKPEDMTIEEIEALLAAKRKEQEGA